jgi:SAM-dependent methyltransferase
MTWRTSLAFYVSRRLVRKSASGPDSTGRASSADYVQWRGDAMPKKFRETFDAGLIVGKDVLDFGCGTGPLSHEVVALGARSCVGLDLDAGSIATARANAKDCARIRFELATDPTRIDLPDESVDVIACADVMEHILEYEAIMREWRRVLRPGGRVLILWQPYWHPYGHHGADYTPIPWVHVFLSHREQREVAARIVDLPDFARPHWDYDKATGEPINRFRRELRTEAGDSAGHLNELTMSRFEEVCGESGLSIERREFEPFSGPWPVPLVSGALTRIPWVREFFTANAVYVLGRSRPRTRPPSSPGP